MESKLIRFEQKVIKKAIQERDQLLTYIDEIAKKTLKEKQIEYKKKAAEIYRKGIDDVRKEARMIISAAKNDGQSSVVAKRDEIINSLFRELEVRLREYVKSEDYREYFAEKLNEAISVVLQFQSIPRTAELVFAEYDYENNLKLAQPGAQRLMSRGIRVQFKKSDRDFIGGCIIVLPNIGRVLDNSIKSLVLKEREQFLSWSNLSL